MVDLKTGNTIKEFQYDCSPEHVIFNKDGTRAYVFCSGDDYFHPGSTSCIIIFDTARHEEIKRVIPPFGLFADSMYLNKDETRLYGVTNRGLIWTMDTSTGKFTDCLEYGGVSYNSSYNPVKDYLYVPGKDGIRILYASTGTDTQGRIVIPGATYNVTSITKDGKYILINDNVRDTLYRVDLNTR